MSKYLSLGVLGLSVLLVTGCNSKTASQWSPEEALQQKTQLGQQLFFDVNLSKNRTQSCATCHNPSSGFVDDRDNGVMAAASLGDDGHSIGDRTAPSAGYAHLIPKFHRNKEGQWVGGQFWDGRASSLADQAAGPPLNPAEMGMESKQAVMERLQENPAYRAQFTLIYGREVFQKADAAYAAMADSIAAFESSDFFSPFDSKYDRFLRGEVELTEQEELGRTLFFSQQFTNCNQCHQLKTTVRASGETFSNYEYHNIGVPTNLALRVKNGVDSATVDQGLFNNPDIDEEKQKGKFKVPTLRNVAVTGPYMHNGVFSDLKTVVLFYDKYNSRSAKRKINPETGKPWLEPEQPENLSLKELEHGPALEDKRVDALVAFMKTLTDKRYEHLLEK